MEYHCGLAKWEAERLDALGFCSRSFVTETCIIDLDDYLWSVGEPENERLIAPIAYQNLLNKISKIRTGDAQAICNFAAEYGLFGLSSLKKEPDYLDEHPCFEINGKLMMGWKREPLSWIWGHIETIQLCLNLIEWIQNRNKDELDGYLSKRRVSDFEEGWDLAGLVNKRDYQCFRISTIAIGEKLYKDRLFFHPFDYSPVRNALSIVASVVEDNTTRVRRLYHFDDVPQKGNARMVARFSAPTLIETIYWQLGDQLSAGQLMRCQADDCTALFVRSAKNQQYCPPPKGKKESRCALRQRQRRFLEGEKLTNS